MSTTIFHFTDKQNEENYIVNSEMKTVLFVNEVLRGTTVIANWALFVYFTRFIQLWDLFPSTSPLFYAVNKLLKLFAQGDIILRSFNHLSLNRTFQDVSEFCLLRIACSVNEML